MTTAPSPKILSQRLRNRIIDCLELAASADGQRDYQRRAPFVDVPYQVINWWNDFVDDDWRQHYTAGDVFTQAEIESIASFHVVWNEVAAWLPGDPLETILAAPEWQRLLTAGEDALQVFLERGRLPED